MQDYSEAMRLVADELEKLESNLIAEINELRASTEIILKELTLYLNISANDITYIKENSYELKRTIESVQSYIKKLDIIENKLIDLPKEIQSLSIVVKDSKKANDASQLKYYNANTANLKKLSTIFNSKFQEVKKEIEPQKDVMKDMLLQMKMLIKSIDSYKEELNREENNLVGVINQLIENQTNTTTAGLQIEDTKLKTNAEINKAKINLYIKIAGGLLGSSGLIWLLIEIISKT